MQAYLMRIRWCHPSRGLLAGAVNPAVLDGGAARFTPLVRRVTAKRHKGLIGPDLTDDRWLHGGSVEQIFQTVAKGWPARGMPPWGRALRPQELAAVVSYVRSLQGSNPPNPRAPEGETFAPEALPGH